MNEYLTHTGADTRTVLSAAPRPVGLLLLLAGVLHLLVPVQLLELAKYTYRRVLDVEFEPQSSAQMRVRLVGLGMIAVGAHLFYHGGLTADEL